MAGFCSLLVIPIGILVLMHGDWRGLFWFAIPASLVAFGKWVDREESDHYVALYLDRIEFPDRKNTVLPLLWSEVQKIRWWVEDDDRSSLRFHVPVCENHPFGRVDIQLDDVSPEDRLKLIQYVREVGKAIEQERWPEFCRKRAVPLAEHCQRTRTYADTREQGELNSRVFESVNRFSRQRPFLAGAMVLPITAILMLLRQVSRRTWWLVAGLIAVSAFINIRLIWGAWVAPFTNIFLGTAIAMFAIGTLAPGKIPGSPSTKVSGLLVHTVLALFLIGLPLFENAAILGWLPPPVVDASRLIFGLSFPVVLVMALLIKARRDEKGRPALESDALRRWEVFEQTGILPDSSVSVD